MKKLLKNKNLFQQLCYVNGSWIKSKKGDAAEVTNPANGKIIGTTPMLEKKDISSAITNADKAFKIWKQTTAKHRSQILKKWHDLIIDNIDDLAIIMTIEQGKPLAESAGEIRYAAAFIEWFAEEAKRTYGDTIPSPISNSKIITQKEPIGVCAAITPWNFPAAMITRKAAPAIAAGCSIIIKPALQTPYSAFALAYLASQAGIPDGVINVVTGDAEIIGKEFTDNSKIRKLTFTGSTKIGKLLMSQAASNLQKISLELGGNAPFIVFEDANLDDAVDGLIASKYRNSGQTCVCANRVFIHHSIHDKFIKKLTVKTKKLKCGDGLKRDITQGPIIEESAIKKIEHLINDAIDKGAKIIYGGKRLKKNSLFFQPTILTDISSKMLINSEEIFGPVTAITKFSSDNEVLKLANNTNYGLASYFYSNDLSRVWKVADQLEYGMVAVNRGVLSTEVAPFGGIKESGIGREGSYMGIEEYLETKYILMGSN